MLEVKKTYRHLYWYFVPVLVITLLWFFKPGYLFFVDFVLGPHIILDWRGASFLPSLFLLLFSYILPIDFLEKIFISLIFLVLIFGAKKFIEESLLLVKNTKKEPERWLVFILSLFIVFNPFVYDRIMYGQIGMVAALGFFALSLLLPMP